ncbi:nitrogen regulation protein NR(II) [Aliidiomarina iranensis]|uniref:histidine kinase n=1 Tax=Aliidiomarina iranensis TaxID=1434071 RepID=A0A432VWL2_9GAMM|nr:nitrogen regulation protein NR(II) [Aliidiomarina iranensis]RUO20945.1 nitrogen regulation protein NR(II) [Aliidiomarina iranensis]
MSAANPVLHESINQTLVDQLTSAVLVLDKNLHVCFANAAADAIFSGSSRRLLGAPLDSHLRYSSFDLTLLRNIALNQQSISDSDVSWVFHDGKSIAIELNASIAAFKGLDSAILVELRQVDLIRRLNQEQAQQHQREAAQQLVRGLAHEIKNPLGGIRGAAQLLNAELQAPEQREFTQLIMAQSDRLRNLVDRLLGPNRPSARSYQNIHAVLQQVLDVIGVNKPANLTISKDYDPSLPDLYISADQIEQVFLNLISNAMDALDQQLGERQIVVRTRVSHQETIYGKRYRQCALICVQDNGPGIPSELKDTLFYPLVTGREGGTGLGLSIAQSLIHQHAGKIEVSSRPGHTEFTAVLPYLDNATGETTTPGAAS